MYTEIINIIKERISFGDTRDQIKEELKSAGYPDDLINELYEESIKETAVLNKPKLHDTEVLQSDAGVIESKVDYNQLKEKVSLSRKPILLPVTIGVAALLLVGGVACGAMFGGFAKVQGFASSLFGGAPYATETELLIGIGQTISELDVFEFTVKAEVNLESRVETTSEMENDKMKESLAGVEGYGFKIPAEGYLKYNLSGLLDKRKPGRPEFDINIEVNTLFEPIIVNAGGSVRLVDNRLYGRVNKIPALYEMFLGDVPKEQWVVLLKNTQEFKENFLQGDGNISPDFFFESTKALDPALVQEVLLDAKSLLTLLPGKLAEGVLSTSGQGQVARSLTALLPNAQPLSEEEIELAKTILRLLEEYPVIKFVGKPEKIKVEGENLFHYEVDIDYLNLKEYVTEAIRIQNLANYNAQSEFNNTEVPLAEDLSEYLLTQANVDQFNKLVTLTYIVQSDGTVVGSRLDTVFALPGDNLTSQIRGLFEITFERPIKTVKVEVPTEVFEKTVAEIMDGRLSAARNAGSEAAIKSILGNMRSQAEIIYNENDYSYSSVCLDLEGGDRLSSVLVIYDYPIVVQNDGASEVKKVVCNDSKNSYAIMAPLVVDENKMWCVDSSGFAGIASSTALISGDDTSCN